jgi:CheY-like chemotaxis protein
MGSSLKNRKKGMPPNLGGLKCLLILVTSLVMFSTSALKAEIRVLIADDDDSASFMMEIRAKKEPKKVDVVRVADGSKALNALKKAKADGQPFHLLISDIQMPHMNGLELLKQLRQENSRFQELRILMHSAVSDNDPTIVEQTRALGADGYLPKIEPKVWEQISAELRNSFEKIETRINSKNLKELPAERTSAKVCRQALEQLAPANINLHPWISAPPTERLRAHF